MGVPKFYGEFISKTSANQKSYRGFVSSLSIDLNGLIHSATQEVFNYSGKDELEEKKRREEDVGKDINLLNQQCFDLVTSKILDLVKQHKPKSLIIAVDGPAPLGKIKQQRLRRYLNKSSDPTMRFNSASISPGTTFMIQLDKHIEQWINRKKTDLPRKVLYSSHLVPGEGEHKIMEFMRKHEVYPKDGGINLLVGDDADLVFLSLLSPMKNIWIVRNTPKGVKYINIDELTRVIMDKGITPEDFTVIAFLLGNDFLPHIVSFSDVMSTLDNAIQAYKNSGKVLIAEDKFNREGFIHLIKQLSPNESNMMKEIAADTLVKPIRALESSKVIKQYGYNTDIEIDFNAFYSHWYINNLSPKAPSKYVPFNIGDYAQQVPEIITDASRCYLNTIAWVFEYYKNGTANINLTWYYPYDFAPLLVDLANGTFSDDYSISSDPVHKFFHPLQQLFMILGPHQSNLIPFNLGSWMTDPNSPLADLYPIDVKTSNEGYKTDWQKDVYLPELDPNRIVHYIKPNTINGIESYYPHVKHDFYVSN